MSNASSPASGGLESPASNVGLEPTPAAAKAAKTNPGLESGGVSKKVKKMRREQESLRERLRAAEKLAEEATKSQQTDAERRDARLAQLEAEAQTWQQQKQELIVKNAVVKAALKRGLDPDLAEKLLNWSTLKIDEETGQPKGIGRALDGLLEQYPILKQNGQQQPSPTIGATNPQQQSTGATGYKVDPLNPPKLGDHLQWGK